MVLQISATTKSGVPLCVIILGLLVRVPFAVGQQNGTGAFSSKCLDSFQNTTESERISKTGCWKREQCGTFAFCNFERCECMCADRAGNLRIQEDDGKCVAVEIIRRHGEFCHDNYQCDIEGGQECSESHCACREGFFWHEALNQCKFVSPTRCSVNSECFAYGAICDTKMRRCKCGKGTQLWMPMDGQLIGSFRLGCFPIARRYLEPSTLWETKDGNKMTEEQKRAPEKESSGLPVWAIVTIIVGVLLLVILLFGAFVFARRKYAPFGGRRSPKNAATVASPLLPLQNLPQTTVPIAQVARTEFKFSESDVLGVGKGGIVYKGQFGATLVAVKTINPNCGRVGMYMDSLDREIEILKRLPGHPNIIKLVAFSACETMRFLLLEVCELKSLREFLLNNTFREGPDYVNLPIKGPLTYKFTHLLNFAQQIATGAEFLASHRIVHGDIACRNVLLASNWVAKVTDFGLAHELDDSPTYIMTRTGLKPWKWSSPEVLIENKFSIQSDVWSFGVTLWEIFSLGAEPYQGLQYFELFPRDLYQGCYRLAKPSIAPIQLYRLMKKCWESEVDNRIGFTALKLQLCDLSRGDNDSQIYTCPGEEGADGYLLHSIHSNPSNS